MLKKNNKITDALTYLYIGLPMMIFLIGWVRWYISVPVCLILLYSFFTAMRKPEPAAFVIEKSHLRTIFIAFLIICGWVYLSGIGGLVYQNADHTSRNRLYDLLVNNPWPVLKTVEFEDGVQTRLLSYYICFFLPSALVGKVFGMAAGFCFQAVWAVFGVVLVYLKISERLNRFGIVPLIVFMLFSGLDILGCALLGIDVFGMKFTNHIEFWGGYQFSSHTTMLFWVFHQAIYGWLLTLEILRQKDNRHAVMIASFGLLTSTFAFVGLLPFLGYRVLLNFREKMKTASPKKALADLFSIENILAGGAVGLISFIYLHSNNFSGALHLNLPTNRHDLYIYLLFMLVEVGVYAMALLRDQERNPLFWISLGVLCVCPLIQVGEVQDFCMRASIPSLLVLCLLVTESFFNYSRKKDRVRFAALLAVFIIGCITPLHEIARTCAGTNSFNGQLRYFDEKGFFFATDNYSSDTENNLFMQYLAK